MAKRPIKKPKSAVNDFIENGTDDTPNKYRNTPYKDKKHKGRSISMDDDFHGKVKQFAEDNPELGGISQMTIRALHEFMMEYKR